jgi:hypothetical protein
MNLTKLTCDQLLNLTMAATDMEIGGVRDAALDELNRRDGLFRFEPRAGEAAPCKCGTCA